MALLQCPGRVDNTGPLGKKQIFHSSSDKSHGGFQWRRHCKVRARKNLGDQLLDYIEAGPKLRKWYGQADSPDEKRKESKQPLDEQPTRDSILVADADSPMGELVLLQLICARLKVIALVGNTEAARVAYGDYVKAFSGRLDDAQALRSTLRSASAVILPGKMGAVPDALNDSPGIRTVLLSTVGSTSSGFLGGLFDGEKRMLSDSRREQQLLEGSAQTTIVRVDKIVDTPGGFSQINLEKNGQNPGGEISREDLAQLLVRALGVRTSGNTTYAVQSQLGSDRFQGWNTVFPA